MIETTTGIHEHNWQPLPQWIGRYRCDDCGAFGYKVGSTHGFGNPNEIRPYACQKKKCGAPAVAKDVTKSDWRGKRKQWRCKNHRIE